MNGVPRRQTPRRPAADEYPERRPHPPPKRKANENGGLGGDGEVVRIISGIIWEVLTGCGYWFQWRFSGLLVSLLSCIYK